MLLCFFFFFKQKTAYEWRIRDGSADVCSSDLECPDVPSCSVLQRHFGKLTEAYRLAGIPCGRTELQRMGHERWKAKRAGETPREIGRASCRERVCQYV